MALNARMDAAQIAELAGRISTQRTSLEQQSASLLSAATRADAFQGNAATQYDAFLEKWRAGQDQMNLNMQEAESLLRRYSVWLQEGDDRMGQGFNV